MPPRRRWTGAAVLCIAAGLAAAACAGEGEGDDALPTDIAATPAAAAGSVTPTDTTGGTPGSPAPAEQAPRVAEVKRATPDPAPAAAAAPADDGSRGIIAGVDTSIRSVELADIQFGFSDGPHVSFAEADEDFIRSLVDAIPPLDAARHLLPPAARARVGAVRYVPAAEAGFLTDGATVLGYVAEDGRPYAFPLAILRRHEIVNDTLGGRAVLITYCPLCHSAAVYDRVVEGRALTFGNTHALHQNDLVMFDRQTNSYWFQTAGEAVLGTLTGSRLQALPSQLAPWATWRQLHPDTLALSTDTGFGSDYSDDESSSYKALVNAGRLPSPVDADVLADTRLDLAELVLGVQIGQTARAYPLDRLGTAAVNDDIDGRAIVVFSSARGPTAAAFDSTADGQRLTFDAEGDAYRDRETGSLWTLSGQAVAGPLEGRQLAPLPTRTAYWFSYRSAFPHVTVADVPAADGDALGTSGG